MITTLGSAVGFMIVMAKPSEYEGFAHHDHDRDRFRTQDRDEIDPDLARVGELHDRERFCVGFRYQIRS